ncbi:hypothetical protein AAFC00_004875 [Neodothiora populina]|uniref:Piwi-domain-containing protein n=1 Tax=Neodothiora populina TaxID=2781224 RepID=A0ABR3P3G4_9PEZI
MSNEARGGGRSRGGRGDGRGSSQRGGFQIRGNDGGNTQRGGHRGPDESRGGSSSRGGTNTRGGNSGQARGRGGSHSVAMRGGRPAPEIYRPNDVPPPDPAVGAAEDHRAKETRSQTIEGFPGRPDHGTKGRRIILRANYFPLEPARGATNFGTRLYRYTVSVTDPQLSKAKSKVMINAIVRLPLFDGVVWATDYRNIIVTTKKLGFGPRSFEQDIQVVDADQPTTQPLPSDPVHVQQARARRSKRFRLQASGDYSVDDLVLALRSNAPGAVYIAKAEVVQLLNVIISKSPSTALNIYRPGQNVFYPDGHILTRDLDLPGGLRALRGYYSSVRTSTHRILLNLNVTSAAFYKPVALRELIIQFLDNTSRRWFDRDLTNLEVFLRHLRVETGYLERRDVQGKTIRDQSGKPVRVRQKKTILGFSYSPRFGSARQVHFSHHDPLNPEAPQRRTSVLDYFRTTHNKNLTYPDDPVVNVGSRNDPIYLPIELCSVMPGQAVKKFLTGPQTASMIRFASRSPSDNALSIAGTDNQPGDGLAVMGLTLPAQESILHPFGLRVGTTMITVPGRILPWPELKYLDQAKQRPRIGSWNLANARFIRPGGFTNWSCLVINYHGNQGNVFPSANVREQLLQNFAGQLQGYGLVMGQRLPTQETTIDRPRPEIRDTIDTELKELFSRAAQRNIEILLVILQEADKWLYARIKLHGDVNYGVQTVCAVGNKIQKEAGQPMYLGNLALKFNIKGGGVSHIIDSKTMPPLDEKLMLVGIDVTHPSPGSADGSPSIAAVVSNIDMMLHQWPGSIRRQTGRAEMVETLTEMMIERLTLWRKKHRALPNKMIIYRDGVSEGQYRLVLETELPAIQEAFKRLYGQENKWPKVTIVVVGKRHHTRFYPTKQEDTDGKSGNPMPGTVVDRGVTDHYLWDFFLQAHQGLQGTARPAHYVVIMDQNQFNQDRLEAFTHSMCYLFNRATKAVSICPPAYYADLLCERGRAYLYSTLNENSSGGNAYNANTAEWRDVIHERVRDKTFYI